MTTRRRGRTSGYGAATETTTFVSFQQDNPRVPWLVHRRKEIHTAIREDGCAYAESRTPLCNKPELCGVSLLLQGSSELRLRVGNSPSSKQSTRLRDSGVPRLSRRKPECNGESDKGKCDAQKRVRVMPMQLHQHHKQRNKRRALCAT